MRLDKSKAALIAVFALVIVCAGSFFAVRSINSRVKPTNADMILGRECVVTEAIDNIRGTGAVTVGGKVWTARMESDEDHAEPGEVLTILRIEGVKLIVRK